MSAADARRAAPNAAPDSEPGLQPGQLLVIYDGRCGVCSRIAARMVALDRGRRAAWMPSQRAGLPEAAGLSAEDVAAAAWAVTPGGARLRGPAAILAGIDAALLGGRAHLAALHRLPGARQALDAGYAWFARHRGRFRGTAICDVRPPSALDDASRAELAVRAARGGWTATATSMSAPATAPTPTERDGPRGADGGCG